MQPDPSEIRVLIVDEDFQAAEMIRGLVEDLGLSVCGNATSGEEAVGLTKFLRPHIVLMDIRLQEGDGIQTTERIQSECPTPVVIVTADEDLEWIQRAEAAGSGAYVIKPPSQGDLEKAMIVALARFKDQQENRRLRRLLADGGDAEDPRNGREANPEEAPQHSLRWKARQ